jgi:hypothetical protein
MPSTAAVLSANHAKPGPPSSERSTRSTGGARQPSPSTAQASAAGGRPSRHVACSSSSGEGGSRSVGRWLAWWFGWDELGRSWSLAWEVGGGGRGEAAGGEGRRQAAAGGA